MFSSTSARHTICFVARMARDAARSFADPESVRILDLYKSSVRESAGKLGVAWLERTPPSFDRPKLTLDPGTPEKPTPPVPRPTPAAHAARSVTGTLVSSSRPLDPKEDTMRDTLIDTWSEIPVDLELTPTSSGEREAVGPRHYDEDITLDALDAPPARAAVAAGETLAPVLPPTAGSYVRLMLVAGALGFIAITVALFGAEYAGIPAHELVQKAWQALVSLAR